MASPTIIISIVTNLAKNKDFRKILLTILIVLLAIVLIAVMVVFYIVSSSIDLLTQLIINPELLALILNLKIQWNNILFPSSGGGQGEYSWPLNIEHKLNREQEDNLFGDRVHPIFGDIRTHTGIDIQAPNGSTCFAIGDGTIEMAGSNGGWGNTVALNVGKARDGKEIVAFYCHLETGSLSVSQGDTVKRGAAIAKTGTTGQTQGGHIHFEIKADGVYVDPMKYVSDSDFGGPLVMVAMEVIKSEEGSYDSINWDWDNTGSLSVGCLQWNSSRYQSTMKLIYDENPVRFMADCQSVGASGYAQAVSTGNATLLFGSDSAYGRALQIILASDYSKSAQDKLMAQEISEYLEVGRSCGITDPKALVFFADCYNQSPRGAEIAAQPGMDLDALYRSSLSSPGLGGGYNWLSPRRTRVYNLIKEYEARGAFN